MLDAPIEQVGDIAGAAGITLHELTPQVGSLEEAFIQLTGDSVEYGGLPGPPAGWVRRPAPVRRRPAPPAGPAGRPVPLGAATRPSGPLPPPPPATARRPPHAGWSAMTLLNVERIKLFSTRSPYWCLAAIAVAALGFATLFGLVENGEAAIPYLFLRGVGLGMSIFMVLAALAVTTEYRFGTIRNTFLGVPRRPKVLLAKTVLLALLGAVVGLSRRSPRISWPRPWPRSRRSRSNCPPGTSGGRWSATGRSSRSPRSSRCRSARSCASRPGRSRSCCSGR